MKETKDYLFTKPILDFRAARKVSKEGKSSEFKSPLNSSTTIILLPEVEHCQGKKGKDAQHDHPVNHFHWFGLILIYLFHFNQSYLIWIILPTAVKFNFKIVSRLILLSPITQPPTLQLRVTGDSIRNFPLNLIQLL